MLGGMLDGADGLTLGALFMGAGAGLVAAAGLRTLAARLGRHYPLSAFATPLVALGLLFGPDLIDQLGGNEVRADQIMRDFNDEAARHPMLARVFRDFPDLKDAMRLRAADAYRAGGKQAFQEAMRIAGAEIQDQVLGYYMLRAGDPAIMTLLATMPPVADRLAGANPSLCRYWFLPEDDAGQAAPHLRAMSDAAGFELVAAWQEAVAALIAGAGGTPFAPDAGWGKATLTALSQALIADHGADVVEMLARVRAPASPEDEAKLCRVVSDFYARLAALDPAEAANAVRAAVGASATQASP